MSKRIMLGGLQLRVQLRNFIGFPFHDRSCRCCLTDRTKCATKIGKEFCDLQIFTELFCKYNVQLFDCQYDFCTLIVVCVDIKIIFDMDASPLVTRLLIIVIVTISSALVLYTIGVWGERIQRRLRAWHVVFFILGVCADMTGTTLMEIIARITHTDDKLHAVTGVIAIFLMFIHAIWAIYTYYRGSDRAKRNFNRFSIVVWIIWLIPYFIGVYMGMTHNLPS